MRATLLTLGLVALATADSTSTVGTFGINDSDLESSIAVPGITSVAASVVSVNALETTYEASCLSGASTESCSIKDPWTITQGISTYHMNAKYTDFAGAVPLTATVDFDCSFETWSTSAACSLSYSWSGSASNTELSSSWSTHTSLETGQVTYYELEVTGGLDKFDKPEATETPGGAAAAFAGPVQAMITGAPVVLAGVVAML
ncbi:hypothetical protein BJY00DRAFT_254170 [Aspergillus carlsbadensis]|nr:hypothetical protein BJY00DRAFT_254170 [Aspergillus carlsbadensis]